VSQGVEAVQLNRITATPDLSFTTVRWVTEIPDPDDEDSVEAVDMFSVVGEQYRLPSVEAAAAAIGNESAFLPPRFWFVPDDKNEHDDQAVAVYATVKDFGYHVGFLPKRQARDYRSNMASLGKPGGVLEVLGCITQGRSSPHPNARVYMPVDFVDLIHSGYVIDPANQVEWLADPSPVLARALNGSISSTFSFEELCKLYCWHARKRGWFCFPDDCESKAEGIRSAGIGLAREAFDPFLRDSSAATAAQTTLDVIRPLKNPFVKGSKSEWFFLANGREHGPLDARSMRVAAKSGILGPNDTVRRGDMEEWVPATKVKGLFSPDHLSRGVETTQPVTAGDNAFLQRVLFARGDLPAPWTVGEFEAYAPPMFATLAPAIGCGSYPIFSDGKRNGGVTGFALSDAKAATDHYVAINRGMGSQQGPQTRIGDESRCAHNLIEMPPQLNLPRTESSELLFRSNSIVVHIRMTDSGPKAAIALAEAINKRLID
jgi:hypothetical protein